MRDLFDGIAFEEDPRQGVLLEHVVYEVVALEDRQEEAMGHGVLVEEDRTAPR